MYKNKKATSIAEAMVVMMIIVVWVVWMYKIYSESIRLAQSVENKIKAIQIANQWIEAFTNIRDTNWIIFPSDYENCWNTLNYDENCIWDTTTTWHNYIEEDSYIIYKDSFNRWLLESKAPWNYSNTIYRNNFRVKVNSNWVYTQSWWIDIKPLYTREIKVDYFESDWTTSWDIKDPKIKITSIVQWLDNTSTQPHKIEIEKMLSNWKTN